MSRRDLTALLDFRSVAAEARFRPDPEHLSGVASVLRRLESYSYLDAGFVDGIFEAVVAGLYRLDALPRDHPFWENTNHRPTFGKLLEFAEAILRYNPSDLHACWMLVASDVFNSANAFGLDGWHRLHRLGALRAAWPISAALYLWTTSGKDQITPLAELLNSCGLQLAARDALERHVYGHDQGGAGWGRRVIRCCPATVDAAWLRWNDGTVRKIAAAVVAEKSFRDLPVLADALQEAGCENDVILTHCRAGVEHWRGCWVVDWLLGKE
jgi:hypothetical protein